MQGSEPGNEIANGSEHEPELSRSRVRPLEQDAILSRLSRVFEADSVVVVSMASVSKTLCKANAVVAGVQRAIGPSAA